jgi:spore coat polysaccharide biosynthesis protein SpsF
MPYGIVRANEPDEAESMQLIKIAIASGINWLDTARAYGRSEDVVGKVNATGWSGRCRIVTKLSPMAECSPNAAPELAEAIAENSLRASCMALQRKALDTVLLHRAAHIGMWGGRVFEVLKTWRTKGLLNTIGVSVQTPEELILSIEDVNIEHVQIPFNILDNRWGTAIDKLRPLRDQRRLTVHVRSAFLQGLLLSDDAEAWQCAHVSDATQIRSWLPAQTAATGYEDVAALCLAFLRSHDWIDGVVVGFDNVKQLEQVLMSANQPLLTQQQLDTLTRTRPVLSVKSLDPSQWRSRDRVEK